MGSHLKAVPKIDTRYVVEDQILPGSKVLDVTAPKTVEVQFSANGRVMWVNVNGILAFRACRIESLIITDDRRK